MTERQLEEQLGDLAGRLYAPPADPDGMLRIAQRRRGRRRRGVALAAAGAVAVVVTGGAVVAERLGDPGSDPGRVGVAGGDTGSVGGDTAPGQDDAAPGRGGRSGPSGLPLSRSERAIIAGMREAVARHLDPEGVHISAEEIAGVNVQVSTSGDAVSSLGTRVGWQVPGESGLGLVAVGVSNDPGSVCPDDVSAGGCTSESMGGLRVTTAVEESGATVFAYRRADGTVVSVSLADLYGNNATQGVGDIDVEDAQVAALLQDPAFTLPE